MIFEELTYQPLRLLEFFAPLANQSWAMLLHSGSAEHLDNRFDILVADPVTVLITHGQNTEIISHSKSEYSNADPLLIMQQQLNKLDIKAQPHPDFPFLGGALGLFGYELGQKTSLCQRAHASTEIAITIPDMAIGFYDWALIADHKRQRLTLICHHESQRRLQWLQQQTISAIKIFHLTSAWQANMSRAQYGKKFQRIQAYLESGDCYQINLAQRFSAGYQGDEWQAFLQLTRCNRTPFSAFLRLPQNVVISLSPERFLSLKNRLIQARPIKGTLPRLEDPLQDQQQAIKLSASEKDRAENLMIVDLLRNDIGRVAQPGSVCVPELFAVERFPTVYHLVSTINAYLATEYTAIDLFRACFPGGSITGAPKIRAMEIITQLEPHRRHAYCGSIGYISCCGSMDTNIAIRTLVTERNTIHCWGGGAVVADSDEEAEYQEILYKLAKILPQLRG